MTRPEPVEGSMTQISDEYDWMPEARVIAAQCWCDAETSGIEMDARLAEAFARRLAAWMRTGAQHARNEEYWRELQQRRAQDNGRALPRDDAGSGVRESTLMVASEGPFDSATPANEASPHAYKGSASPAQQAQPVGWWGVIDGDGNVVITFKHEHSAHEHVNEALTDNQDDAAIFDQVKLWRVRPLYAAPPQAAPAQKPRAHGPVSERFMRHHYGASGYHSTNAEGPEELGPRPAPGLHFDARGVLVPDAAPQPDEARELLRRAISLAYDPRETRERIRAYLESKP